MMFGERFCDDGGGGGGCGGDGGGGDDDHDNDDDDDFSLCSDVPSASKSRCLLFFFLNQTWD